MKPIIGDVESFVLIDAHGCARTCSRTENADLFRLAIGGYGLFGPIATVRLRLIPRQKIRRVVEVRNIDDLPAAFEQRIVEYAGSPDPATADLVPIDTSLWPTSMVFRQGHRIRLEVASSNFPRYDRNLNTGAPIATATVTAVARQAVHHRPGALSRIALPVVPSGSSRLKRD